jgi:hypothetical protein
LSISAAALAGVALPLPIGDRRLSSVVGVLNSGWLRKGWGRYHHDKIDSAQLPQPGTIESDPASAAAEGMFGIAKRLRFRKMAKNRSLAN